jgi:hypothetical protein
MAMAKTTTKLSPALKRLLPRTLLGSVVGIVVVIFYFGMDFMGHANERLYFIDHRETVFTLLTLGIVIGTAIGFAWAMSGSI